MIDHQNSTTSRRYIRRAALAASVGLFASVVAPVAAIADTPRQWAVAPHVSGWQFLVVLVLIPAALFVVISLLAALPSMISDKGYEPGQAWRAEGEWFGGASKGVPAEGATPEIESADAGHGGTSGQW